jgi:hypothetical protein
MLHRSWQVARAKVLAPFAVCALATLMVMTPSGAAQAATPTWTITPSPNVTLPGGDITSVSCLTADSCTAVGSYTTKAGLTSTLAETWDGTSWHKQKTANPAVNTVPAVAPTLTGVSCPAAGNCEAVGAYTDPQTYAGVPLAELWNGQSWILQSVPEPAGAFSAALFAVSCTSTTFCEATGSWTDEFGNSSPLAEVWNGSSWTAQSVPSPAGEVIQDLSHVSCTAATFCEAIGGSPLYAVMWDGATWTDQAMPGSVGAVSCVSATYCVAVGSAGPTGSAVWDGTSWAAVPAPAGVGLDAVSCPSATFCEAVGGSSTAVAAAETWDGTSWAVQPIPSPTGVAITDLDAVSCASADACEAGGDFEITEQNQVVQAFAEGWDGASWVMQDAARPAGATTNELTGVSCVSARFCEAVGNATDVLGNEITLAEGWDGTSWKIQATPDTALASATTDGYMSGVSCVTADFCEAVGLGAAAQGPAAWAWNGTSWNAQAVPGSGYLVSVSCTSPGFCMAVSGTGGVETWNGSAWSLQSDIPGFTFTAGPQSLSCLSATFCEVVGVGSSGTQDAAAWNGTGWTSQAMPLPSDGNDMSVNAVSCASASFCQAVGWYFNSTFEQLTLAETWNGSTWTAENSPNPPTSTINTLDSVWCTSATFCAAVGEQTPSTVGLTLAQVWDGTAWTTQTTANRSQDDINVLNSVWCDKHGNCTAVGIGADRGSVNATLVEVNA